MKSGSPEVFNVKFDQSHPPMAYPGPKAKIDIRGEEHQVPDWIEMIHDLVHGAGYSYSRIAYRVKCSPSTIQKLATQFDRKPRFRVYDSLLRAYVKIFYGQFRSKRARDYVHSKPNRLHPWLEAYFFPEPKKYVLFDAEDMDIEC